MLAFAYMQLPVPYLPSALQLRALFHERNFNMQSRGVMDDSPAPSDTLDLAQRLPGTLISAAAGEAEHAVRSPGLILTKEQLIDLKRYEIHGLALPTALNDVIQYLGYERGAGPNLEARDFQVSFTCIHNHAARWNPLRTELMNTGSELWVFADQMQVYETAVQQLYTRLRGNPEAPVVAADQADFQHYIQQVAARVLQRRNAGDALKGRLDAFAQELSTTVMPAVLLKLRSIDTNNLPTDILQLNTAINNRAERIEEKQREYKVLVNKSIGTSFALIGLGIYNGVEAAKVRKQLTALRQEQQNSILLLEQKNKIHASLQRVRNDLSDLNLVVLDADIATSNLTVVWNGLHIYLNESVQEAGRVNNSLTLRRLMNAFKLVAQPWGQIKTNADTLLKVFKDADRDFRRDYAHQ